MNFKIDFKNPWFRRAGLILAVIPFIWIYRRLDFHTMLAILPKIAWWTIPQIVVGTIVSMTIQGTRWWLLIYAFSPQVPFWRAISYHFISIYYSTVLPTSASQEVLRALFVQKQAGLAVSWGAAWICKITALLLSLACSIYGLAYLSKSSLPHGVMTTIEVFSAVMVIAGVLSFSKRFTSPVRRLLSSILPKAIITKAETVREGIYQYRNKKKDLLITLLLTTVIQILQILILSLLIKGITGRLHFFEWLAFIPIIELISVSQPFTPNGLGVREALYAVMFSYIGLSKEQLGIYIAILLTTNLLRLTGAIPLIFDAAVRRKKLSTGGVA